MDINSHFIVIFYYNNNLLQMSLCYDNLYIRHEESNIKHKQCKKIEIK